MTNTTKLRELERAATPGEWTYHDNGFDGGICLKIQAHEKSVSYIFGGEPCEGRIEPDDPDAALVVAMRNALPEMLDEVEKLRKELGVEL